LEIDIGVVLAVVSVCCRFSVLRLFVLEALCIVVTGVMNSELLTGLTSALVAAFVVGKKS
jgi:hypothetical protein